jgi:hypothetical protein
MVYVFFLVRPIPSLSPRSDLGVTPELPQLLQEHLVSGQQDVILAMRIKKTSNYRNYDPRGIGVHRDCKESAVFSRHTEPRLPK